MPKAGGARSDDIPLGEEHHPPVVGHMYRDIKVTAAALVGREQSRDALCIGMPCAAIDLQCGGCADASVRHTTESIAGW